MLMNYEKCDQVLFPLLQQTPGPLLPPLYGSIFWPKINYILPALPHFSKLHIRLMNPIVQIGKK